MAIKKTESAAEQELLKAEAEAHKLHPLLTQGVDVAPITRGEMKVILEDLLGKLASGGPIEVKSDELSTLEGYVRDLAAGQRKLTERVTKLEDDVLRLSAAGSAAVAAPASVDTSGAEDLKKLSLKALKEFAATHNIDISSLPEEKDLLADYIAANLNIPK